MKEPISGGISQLPAFHPRGATAGVTSLTHSIYLLSQALTSLGTDLPEQHNTHREGVEGRWQEGRPCSATSVGRDSLALGLGLLLQQGTLSTPAQG